MTAMSKLAPCLAFAFVLSGSAAWADPPHEHEQGGPRSEQGGPRPEQGGPHPEHGGPHPDHEGGHPGPRPEEHPHGEPHPGPRGYQRVDEPHGWNARPPAVDRDAYHHNFQAARSFRIGPYHRPHGWTPHHWGYGETLPRAYWAAPYVLADYWLFALEVPPPGYEWVRDDNDALLVNTDTGEILQVEYGVFG